MSAAHVAAQLLAFAADQAIAQADQVIADVDRRADAVLAVQRLPAVAEGVVVLDVVVDQRRLVERLDGQGGAADGVGQVELVGRQRARAALERVVGGQRDERPRPLAALAEPVVGDVLVLRERIVGRLRLAVRADLARPRRQPRQLRLLADLVRRPHQVDVASSSSPAAAASCRSIISNDPVVIDRRAAAVARQAAAPRRTGCRRAGSCRSPFPARSGRRRRRWHRRGRGR